MTPPPFPCWSSGFTSSGVATLWGPSFSPPQVQDATSHALQCLRDGGTRQRNHDIQMWGMSRQRNSRTPPAFIAFGIWEIGTEVVKPSMHLAMDRIGPARHNNDSSAWRDSSSAERTMISVSQNVVQPWPLIQGWSQAADRRTVLNWHH